MTRRPVKTSPKFACSLLWLRWRWQTAKTRPRGAWNRRKRYPWVTQDLEAAPARRTPLRDKGTDQKLRDVVDHQRQNYGPTKSGRKHAPWQWAAAGKAVCRCSKSESTARVRIRHPVALQARSSTTYPTAETTDHSENRSKSVVKREWRDQSPDTVPALKAEIDDNMIDPRSTSCSSSLVALPNPATSGRMSWPTEKGQQICTADLARLHQG